MSERIVKITQAGYTVEYAYDTLILLPEGKLYGSNYAKGWLPAKGWKPRDFTKLAAAVFSWRDSSLVAGHTQEPSSEQRPGLLFP